MRARTIHLIPKPLSHFFRKEIPVLKILPRLLALLLVNLLSPAQAADPSALKLDGDIAVTIPAGWIVNSRKEMEAIRKDSAGTEKKPSSGSGDLVLSAVAKSMEAGAYIRVFKPSPIDVKKVAAASDEDLEGLGKLLAEKRRQSDPGYLKLHSSQTERFGDYKAVVLKSDVSNPLGEKDAWLEWKYIVFVKDRMIEVALTCRGTKEGRYRKDMNRIKESLRF
jgi:hypothetical protein